MDPRKIPPESVTFYSNCSATLWRNTAYYTGLAPYPSIPHLRGNYFSGGRLPYLRNNQFANNMREAAALGGMCTFWVESKLTILITDPSLVYLYKVRGQTNFTYEYHDNIDKLFGWSATCHEHLTTRKFYHDALTGKSFKEMEKSVADVADAKITDIKNNNNPVIDHAGSYFRELMFELAAQLFMGIIKDSLLTLDHKKMIAYIDKLFAGMDDDYLLYVLNLKEIPKNNTDLEQRIQAFRKARMQEFKELILDKCEIDPDSVFHKLWTASKNSNQDEEHTLENLFPEVFFFLIGGPVSSLGDSFPIIMQLICQHKEIQQKLSGLLLTNENDALIYLDQIIKEALRLHPPVAVIPTRTVKEDFTLNGITIRAGDNIVVSPLVNHHDPAYWPEPEKFDPERFAPGVTIQKGTYLPFGLGDRECPGSKYGLLVLKTFIAKLFREFDVNIKKDSTLQLVGPTTVTSDKLEIYLNPREPAYSAKISKRK